MTGKRSWFEILSGGWRFGLVCGVATVLLFGSGLGEVRMVYAQDRNEDEGKETTVQDEGLDDGEPTLDELLGLGDAGEEGGGDGEAGLPDVHDVLDGEAEGAEGPAIVEMFLAALKAMNASAGRLLDRQDAGLITQRYQEDALLKLTSLIQQAERQQQQKPSPGGQPSPQEGKRKPGNPQSSPGATPGDQAAQQDSRPPGREVDLEGEISENRREWGSLPARVRDLLLQGRSESPASLYRRLTELYYKRLAEESAKDGPK